VFVPIVSPLNKKLNASRAYGRRVRSNNCGTADASQTFSNSACFVDHNLLRRVLSHADGRNFKNGFSRKCQDNEA
jgi:hypothetical protein